MSNSDPTPEEREAEEQEMAAAKEKSRRDLDKAIEDFAAAKATGDLHADFAREEIVKAAVEYALRHDATLLNPAEGIFRIKFLRRAGGSQ